MTRVDECVYIVDVRDWVPYRDPYYKGILLLGSILLVVGLSRPCRGEVVPSPCAAVFGLTFPYPQHILYYIRPRVLRSCSTVHMVLEHFRIVVTPKLPMHETIASIPRKAEVVPIPVCPWGNGPGIILYIKSQCLALPRAGLAQGRATLAQGHKYAPPQNN